MIQENEGLAANDTFTTSELPPVGRRYQSAGFSGGRHLGIVKFLEPSAVRSPTS